MQVIQKRTYSLPISGRVDRASATQTVNRFNSQSGQTKDHKNLVFSASLLDDQQLKRQCKASIMCGSQVTGVHDN